jgi:Tfp pilus assembly protein PilN
MIKTNLSTRPFYNERAVHFWLLVVALFVALATIFNITRVLRYSRSDTQLATEAVRNEARAADLRQQAAQLRATVDPKQIEYASTEARQANDLIDRRTFSWTDLFNRFEATLPDEVRIAAIRSRLDEERGIVLTLNVASRTSDDIDTFMENLEETKAFTELGSHLDEHVNDEGLLETMIEMVYIPTGPKPPATRAGAGQR